MYSVAVLSLLCLAYPVVLVTYRLWFSPVAHIPGPLLARATYWYEFYYDVILRGRYTFKVKELHKRYGPIIRVNPHEVHIHDADFYDQIYAGPSKRMNRWSWQAQSFPFKDVMITAVDHEDHRRKRAPLNQYFSKAKVKSLQPTIENVIHKTLTRFEEFKKAGKPLHLDAAMFSMSNDIIMQYAFGKSYNRTAADDFDLAFHRNSVTATQQAHVMKHLPMMQTFINLVPEETLKAKSPVMAGYLQLQKVGPSRDLCQEALTSFEDIKHEVVETQRQFTLSSKKSNKRTIFHELLESNSPLTQHFPFLYENGIVVVLGATTTTATVMYITIFHLLSNPHSLKRLRHELDSSLLAAEPELSTIENLPYLTAVIKEGLRMSGTVTTRLQRINPVATTVYTDRQRAPNKSYSIPSGTPMSSTVLLIHYDPEYYPEPYQFRPERWLAENGNVPPLERHFVPFLKGTTQCIGMNLAYAEVYLLLYHLFKKGGYGCEEAKMEGDRGKLELFETNARDIEVVGDGLGPIYRSDSKGVRIMVKE